MFNVIFEDCQTFLESKPRKHDPWVRNTKNLEMLKVSNTIRALLVKVQKQNRGFCLGNWSCLKLIGQRYLGSSSPTTAREIEHDPLKIWQNMFKKSEGVERSWNSPAKQSWFLTSFWFENRQRHCANEISTYLESSSCYLKHFVQKCPPHVCPDSWLILRSPRTASPSLDERRVISSATGLLTCLEETISRSTLGISFHTERWNDDHEVDAKS